MNIPMEGIHIGEWMIRPRIRPVVCCVGKCDCVGYVVQKGETLVIRSVAFVYGVLLIPKLSTNT